MSRYIDADALIIDYYDDYETKDDIYTYAYVSEAQIDSAPSIDIVRCKECRFGQWHEQAEEYICIAHDQDLFDGDHFCSYGERRSDGSI